MLVPCAQVALSVALRAVLAHSCTCVGGKGAVLFANCNAVGQQTRQHPRVLTSHNRALVAGQPASRSGALIGLDRARYRHLICEQAACTKTEALYMKESRMLSRRMAGSTHTRVLGGRGCHVTRLAGHPASKPPKPRQSRAARRYPTGTHRWPRGPPRHPTGRLTPTCIPARTVCDATPRWQDY